LWECRLFGFYLWHEVDQFGVAQLLAAPPASLFAQNGANCCGDGLIQDRRMGRYIDEILQPGERVLYSTNEHWMFFLPAIAAWIVAVAFLVLWRLVAADALMLVCVALAAVAGLAALYWTATAWFHRWTTETDVTNMRVVHKTGFIKRRTFEMSLDKVESVDVNQSILGRLLNYGDITIQGVGEGTQTISTIASPLAFRNAITTRPVGT
jgi:membrane protein YdbS with pleckstrin-like domain